MDNELPLVFILFIGAIIWLIIHFIPGLNALLNSPLN